MRVPTNCPICHNVGFHFDGRKHAVVCDVCGWEANGDEDAQTRFEYDRNRQKADAFIRSGYYDRAIAYLENMKESRPDDPEIYKLHLMGQTRCLRDYLEDADGSELSEGKMYWEKYCMLGGDINEFVPYTEERKKRGLARHKGIIRRSLWWLMAFLAAAAVFGILALAVSRWFASGAIFCLWLIFITSVPNDLYASLKAKKRIETASDPFFEMKTRG